MQAKRLGGFLTVVVAILAVGVGYAAFTSQVTLNGNASAGTLSIQWIGPAYPAVTTTDPNLTCNVTLTPSVVTMTVGGLYPGASCTMPLSDKVVVKNVGTLPAAIAGVYAAGPVTGPSSPCTSGNFYVANSGYSPTLSSGSSFPWFQTIGLESSAGNGCQGDTFTFTIYFNATVA